MIEGKLTESGREPRNVQVVVGNSEASAGASLALWDDEGEFLQAEPEEETTEEQREPADLESEPDGEEEEIRSLRAALREATTENESLRAQVSSLSGMVMKEKTRAKEMWRANCEYLAEHDELIAAKDAEIESLKSQLLAMEQQTRESTPSEPDLPHVEPLRPLTDRRRRGKAPPVDSFTGEDMEIQLDDWIPALKRASVWNGWSDEELLLQLMGHLRGRALQEWNLLDDTSKTTYSGAIEALRTRLDPGNRAFATQDFRHTVQGNEERVADFIRRLERTFRVAYGRNTMSAETRDMLLHSQLQEGLRYELMRGPAVSGAQIYQELCLAAKNEEKRLAELKKRQQYMKPAPPTLSRSSKKTHDVVPTEPKRGGLSGTRSVEPKKCYTCGKVGHFARDCRMKRTESADRVEGKPANTTRQVKSSQGTGEREMEETNLLDLLYSSEEESDVDVCMIRISDQGSRPQCAQVQIQGVPVYGIIDSGADITIIGGGLFRKVAAAAKLRKRDLKKPDKMPCTYDHQPFTLDGRMDLDISFDDKTMCTPVYIKMDAREQLLLSEGVCRQLNILSYHADVQTWRGGRKQTQSRKAMEQGNREATVPTVRVNLVQSVHLPPGKSTVVVVQTEPCSSKEPLLLEYDDSLERALGIQIPDTLFLPSEEGRAHLVVTNPSGYTQVVQPGATFGRAVTATVVPPGGGESGVVVGPEELHPPDIAGVKLVAASSECVAERKHKLSEMIGQPEQLSPEQTKSLHEFVAEDHEAFCLDKYERGETDLVQLEIDTGDAVPKRQPVQRMPFAVRQEVARQLKNMQEAGVVRPSSSPWACPVVMVRKKDGSHQFCVDYRQLSSVTKADTFPLPRIDDLLDQLGESKFFTTLDLAAGYWQIRVHPNSKEKTAFITPQDLYEFQVMPLGLTNAPSVFQRLMQRVLLGLNPEEGPDFVAVYINDVLVFSRTLEEHIQHLQLVIKRIRECGLKLKPAKCHFIRKEVEYLGHTITPEGLTTNPRLVTAVKEFPIPCNVREVRQFLGLSSYYRRFIPQFSKVAQPLHLLTRKGAEYQWSPACQAAFEALKQKLAEAPVLAYPSFDRDFVLETDASIQGIGAVLSQLQDDDKLHPVAYASRVLSPQERNYSITELETLAVVWAVTHFHTYLYGHCVTIYTDHTAVKAILETPNPTGQHARWWTKVYGRGVKEVHIVYRAGKTNLNADALSQSPQAPAPEEGIAEAEIQVAAVRSSGNEDTDIQTLLQSEPGCPLPVQCFAEEQRKDPKVLDYILFLEKGELPLDQQRARKVALQETLFTIVDQILYYVDPKQTNRRRAVVPCQLQEKIMEESHRGPMGGHFSGDRLFKTLARHWWWKGMYADVSHYAKICPECAIVSGGGRVNRPPLHPIPVQRPFQIVGVDVMELPKTTRGNKLVLVFQDFLTKWPMVYPMPDQKASQISQILVEEVIPFFGVPESLLSDRGTNLLSHLMLDGCQLLGIKKLNTTAYHPQCDGMVERFNCTLKAMLRKHAPTFGSQWDRFLHGVLWAYRNTPHESTGETPSFLLFGIDCRTPTEAALLPANSINALDLTDYREEMILALSSARNLAVRNIQQAQKRYKDYYDRKATKNHFRVGDWVLVRFPAEKSGKDRKLSHPWHGPYRVVDCREPDITVAKIYRPQDGQIQIHQMRVTPCPPDFPAGYFWYGKKQHSPGRPLTWVEELGRTVDAEVSTADHTSELPDTCSDVEDQPTATDSETEDVTALPQPQYSRATARGRYSLRHCTAPPNRFM